MSAPPRRACVITGAGGSIGAAVADVLARQGFDLALLDTDETALGRVCSEVEQYGSAVLGLTCDVSDEVSVRDALAAARARLNEISYLVTCAGSYLPPRPTEDLGLEAWRSVVDSNLTGSFVVIRELLRGMKERRAGTIVTIASNAGRSTATALGVEYTAAKAGVLGLTRHVAREAAPFGVRVNCVAPGPTRGRRLDDLADKAALADIAASIPLGRLGEPHEIARVVAFLLSDDASFITGAPSM